MQGRRNFSEQERQELIKAWQIAREVRDSRGGLAEFEERLIENDIDYTPSGRVIWVGPTKFGEAWGGILVPNGGWPKED